jgi:uncharacterized integral membrane protein
VKLLALRTFDLIVIVILLGAAVAGELLGLLNHK